VSADVGVVTPDNFAALQHSLNCRDLENAWQGFFAALQQKSFLGGLKLVFSQERGV
jgi:DNA gyrase inhibitor GyrI